MVTQSQRKYYLAQIERVKLLIQRQIVDKYPDIHTDYASLIADGKGTLKPESAIREMVGNTSRYTCPALIEVVKLFDLTGCKTRADSERNLVLSQRQALYSKLERDVQMAQDMAMFGTDEQLLAMLAEINAWTVE